MSSQGNLPILARAIQLFGYEEDDGEDSPLWTHPQNFDRKRHKEAFADWMGTKRSFEHDEIGDTLWLSLREQENALLLRCLANESVRGTNLFHRDRKFQGSWFVIDSGIEGIHILKIDILDRYSLYVFASSDNPIHSGIGLLKEQGTPTYFKFIELR